MLFMGGAASFFDFFDKLFNNELFKSERAYSVNVNVYEVKGGANSGMSFEKELGDTPGLEDALKHYFVEYNNVLGSLSGDTNELSSLYERHSRSKGADFLILERQIHTRKQAAIDLRFAVCDVGLQLTSVSFGAEDFVEIRVLECFAAVFDGIGDKLSSYAGVEHFFVFDKRSGQWLINRHESNSALSLYITDELDKLIQADGHSIGTIDALTINDYAAQLKTVLERDVYFIEPESEIVGEDENDALNQNRHYRFPYERDMAVQYAGRFTHRERVRRNHEFKEFPRNGTNFTSQCINSGGIPAEQQWTPEADTWVNAAKFYEYITSADSHIAARLCSYTEGEAGDIVQFIDGGGGAIHSALIVDTVYGNTTLNIEYLITANSEELSKFPLSALGFDIMRIIKIDGFYWNQG